MKEIRVFGNRLQLGTALQVPTIFIVTAHASGKKKNEKTAEI